MFYKHCEEDIWDMGSENNVATNALAEIEKVKGEGEDDDEEGYFWENS